MGDRYKKKISFVMSDIRPISGTGNLGLRRNIKTTNSRGFNINVKNIESSNISKISFKDENKNNNYSKEIAEEIKLESVVVIPKAKVYQFGKVYDSDEVPIVYEGEGLQDSKLGTSNSKLHKNLETSDIENRNWKKEKSNTIKDKKNVNKVKEVDFELLKQKIKESKSKDENKIKMQKIKGNKKEEVVKREKINSNSSEFYQAYEEYKKNQSWEDKIEASIEYKDKETLIRNKLKQILSQNSKLETRNEKIVNVKNEKVNDKLKKPVLNKVVDINKESIVISKDSIKKAKEAEKNIKKIENKKNLEKVEESKSNIKNVVIDKGNPSNPSNPSNPCNPCNPSNPGNLWSNLFAKPAMVFSMASVMVLIVVMTISVTGSFVNKGMNMKGEVLGAGDEAYDSLMKAVENVKSQNFSASQMNFENAYNNFSQISEELENFGGSLIDISRFVPELSKLSSGKNLAEAGKHFSLAGKALNESIQIVSNLDNPLGNNTNNQDSLELRRDFSLLDMYQKISENINQVNLELKTAEDYLAKVKIDDLPVEKQSQFSQLKNSLPIINSYLEEFSNNSYIFVELLGGNGPRKYLFLFQNNQEMRPTGGFIGSYGLLDINQGKIRKFFIDGIFNPDGQLKAKIIPPKPIQKISAAWSLHDSNWFPDFPLSAKKAIFFYEKTGGPSVDGIITLTPVIMEKLLEITGPIEMEEYEVTLSADNFIEKTQYKVEIDYNEEENRPKKILADLAPIVLDKIFNARDLKTISKTVTIFSEALQEKQILFYSQDSELQKIISDQGWAGEILDTKKDYLSVINSNINGFKTDGVIEEKINHEAKIEADGSIIDTVTIRRKHNGGDTGSPWWDKVNANYMRVYVPLGSELLSAQGHTYEFNEEPIDYSALSFRIDSDLEKIEKTTQIDEESGTRIFEESGKTVFGNWVYVSPQEEVTVKYEYRLPFRVDNSSNKIVKMNNSNSEEEVKSYSLLIQKQAGSLGSYFKNQISFPVDYDVYWKTTEDLEVTDNSLEWEGKLRTDKFLGVVFE